MLKLGKYQRHRKAVDHLLSLIIVSRKKLCTHRKVKLSIRNIIKRDLTLHQARENLFQFYDKNKSKFSQSRFLIGALSAAGIIYGLNVAEKWLFPATSPLKKEDSTYDSLTKEEALSNNRFKPVKNVTTSFCDIQGCDEAKQDLENLVHFLRNPQKFNELGATLPRGVILVGPPGVGKTSLAKAVAGEAKDTSWPVDRVINASLNQYSQQGGVWFQQPLNSLSSLSYLASPHPYIQEQIFRSNKHFCFVFNILLTCLIPLLRSYYHVDQGFMEIIDRKAYLMPGNQISHLNHYLSIDCSLVVILLLFDCQLAAHWLSYYCGLIGH